MTRIFQLVVLFVIIADQIQAQVISQWRGDNRSGTYKEENLLEKWPENGPALLWSVKGIGEGYSCASVTEDAIYLTGLVDTIEYVTALDLGGNKLWQTAFGPGWNGSFAASRSTPTVVNGNIYVVSGQGHLACLNSKTGDIVWKLDAYNKFEGEWDIWGVAESPLYHDGKIFYTPCGERTTMVALNAISGETVWESDPLPDSSAYVSPILINHRGREMIVSVTSNYIFTVDPENGDIIWKITYSDIYPPLEHPDFPISNTNSPLYHDGQIYVTSGYNHVGVMFRMNEEGNNADLIWTDSTLDVHHGGVVLLNGYIYGANFLHSGNGNWCCIDWKTGETMFEAAWINKGSIIAADNKLYCYEEKTGNIALVEPSTDNFNIISTFRPIDRGWPHWSHLVIRDGILYVRYEDILMAYDIKDTDLPVQVDSK
jgi:outer membrane protein assembly factor BamB